MPGHVEHIVEPADTDARASYVAPELRDLGDVRDLTLGASPGTGDSGGSGTHRAMNRPGQRQRT